MAYDLGFKLLRSMCQDQDALKWYRAKLSDQLFIGPEKPVFKWVEQHVHKHHSLPQIITLEQAWPLLASVEAPEPSSYYTELVENAYFYRVINQTNLESQGILKSNQNDWAKARDVLRSALQSIAWQQHRTNIMNLAKDGPQAVFGEYHGVGKSQNICWFGWDYMDSQSGGCGPGDLVSFIGRPAQGKTWMMLYIALNNWRLHKKNVLFVSMEMNPLAIAQRVTSMYAQVPYKQLLKSQFSTPTYTKFLDSMKTFSTEEADFWVIDGNLAMGVEDVYDLADLLGCHAVVIDGAYLLQNRDGRLDRYARVAENTRIIKRATGALMMPTFASWQFARSAVKDKKDKEKKPGLEDIGSSDEIGQISSLVLAMDQDDSVETLVRRWIRCAKGRAGQVGGFPINWLFDVMNFEQAEPEEQKKTLVHI
jgi:replicative DNA helicase